MAKMGLEVYVARAAEPYGGGYVTLGGVNVYNMKYDRRPAIIFGLKNLFQFPFSRLFRLRGLGFLVAYGLHIAKLAKKHEIDVIHAHFATPSGFAALLAKNVTKKPLVISVWGADVQSDPKSGYGSLQLKYARDMVVRALNGADAITVGAAYHDKAIRDLIGEDKANKIFFIQPGLDINRFSPSVNGNKVRKKYKIKTHQTVILFARHLVPIYRPEYLIRAATKVIRKHPGTIFLILGGGPLRNELQELARRMGVNRNIIFIGYVPKTEMPFYHAASDIFVDPCIFGQGYASLEALSCGKPVIGFKIGQIRVIDGVDGFLVKPGNIEDLADKMIWLIENPKLRKEMGMKGRKRVVEEQDFEKRVNTLIKLYNRLLCV